MAPDAFQSHFTSSDLSRVSASSCEAAEAGAIIPILQVKRVRFGEGYWQSGLEPLEPSLVFFLYLSLYPEQTDSVPQTDPCLFEREGVCFKHDVGSVLLPRPVLHSKRDPDRQKTHQQDCLNHDFC